MLVVLACQKERLNDTANENDAKSMSLADAKNFYDSNKQPDMVLKDGKVGESRKMGIKPDWSNGTTSKNDDIEVVEVGLLVQGGFGFADKSVYDEWNANKQNGLKNSLTRMVFTKNKKSGKIEQFLMSIIGDKEYHDNKESRLKENAYLKREKHFSGHIIYHDLAGNYANGWKYEKGKLVATTTQTSGDVLQTNLKMATTCFSTPIYKIYVDCVDWWYPQTGEYIGLFCGDPYKLMVGFTDCPSYFTGSGSFGIPIGCGGVGTPGGYIPPTVPPTPCTCVNTCPVCGKCLDTSLLKSAGVDACAICTCPLPVVLVIFGSNLKAECIYQTLSNGLILQHFISRYFGATKPHQSFLGELNLTWTLGSVQGGFGQTIPIGYTNNSQSYSVEIRLDEVRLNGASNTKVALTMLHEALHAKLIADFYDDVRSTDFTALFAYYKGWGINGGGIDINQETEMLTFYSDEMATALKSFDMGQGIDHPLSFYTDAVKYNLGSEIFSKNVYPQGVDAYNTLLNSSIKCE